MVFQSLGEHLQLELFCSLLCKSFDVSTEKSLMSDLQMNDVARSLLVLLGCGKAWGCPWGIVWMGICPRQISLSLYNAYTLAYRLYGMEKLRCGKWLTLDYRSLVLRLLVWFTWRIIRAMLSQLLAALKIISYNYACSKAHIQSDKRGKWDWKECEEWKWKTYNRRKQP